MFGQLTLEETIQKRLEDEFKKQIEAQGITDRGVTMPVSEIIPPQVSGLGQPFPLRAPFAKLAEKLAEGAKNGETTLTKTDLVDAAKPFLQEQAGIIAEGIRAQARGQAQAFKRGDVVATTPPELPAARTVAIRNMPDAMRARVREEDPMDVSDFGYDSEEAWSYGEPIPVSREEANVSPTLAAIAGSLGGMSQGVPGEPDGIDIFEEKDVEDVDPEEWEPETEEAFDIEEAGAAFGADITRGAAAFGADITRGAAAFGSLGQLTNKISRALVKRGVKPTPTRVKRVAEGIMLRQAAAMRMSRGRR